MSSYPRRWADVIVACRADLRGELQQIPDVATSYGFCEIPTVAIKQGANWRSLCIRMA